MISFLKEIFWGYSFYFFMNAKKIKKDVFFLIFMVTKQKWRGNETLFLVCVVTSI